MSAGAELLTLRRILNNRVGCVDPRLVRPVLVHTVIPVFICNVNFCALCRLEGIRTTRSGREPQFYISNVICHHHALQRLRRGRMNWAGIVDRTGISYFPQLLVE